MNLCNLNIILFPIAIAFTLLSDSFGQASNLIQNGDFSDGLNGWKYSDNTNPLLSHGHVTLQTNFLYTEVARPYVSRNNGRPDFAVAVGETYSEKVTPQDFKSEPRNIVILFKGDKSGGASINQKIKCIPGKKYDVSFMCRTLSIPRDFSFCYLNVRFFDEQGREIKLPNPENPFGATVCHLPLLDIGWMRYTLVSPETPNNAVEMLISFSIMHDAVGKYGITDIRVLEHQ
jgi:hypothetical protein